MSVMAQRCFRLRVVGVVVLTILLLASISSSFALAFQQAKPGEDEIDQLFISYPKSPGLAGIIYSHRSLGQKIRGLILYATWFPDGNPRVAYRCFATDNGQVSSNRLVYDWAVRDSYFAQLGEPELGSLKNSMRALPRGAKSPPLADLLVVSFRDGEGWETRTYDRKRVPDEVKDIYKVTGCTNWYEHP
jgi:hypothetical protein